MRPTDAAWNRKVRAGFANSRLLRRGLVPAAVLAGTVGSTTLAGAATSQPVVTSAKIAGLGTILVASHRPLYEMANDPPGRSTCSGTCATKFKPLLVSHKAAHHLGHVSGLGTIHLPHGKLQVAIHRHALYFFDGDHSLSHAGAQGFANNWFTVHTNGTLNRTSTKVSTPMLTVPNSTPNGSSASSSTTTPPKSAPANPSSPAPNSPAPNSPAPSSPAPTSPPPTTPPTTTPPPPPTTTPPPPPTTTTTTAPSGGGVGF